MEKANPELVVDLRKFAKRIRKLDGAPPVVAAINDLLDAASVVPDIKLAREAVLALGANYDAFVGSCVETAHDASALIPIALLDLAVVRYVRGTHASGTRKPLGIAKKLPPDLKLIHDEVVRTRDKYVSHSTSEKMKGLKVESTVVWNITVKEDGVMFIKMRTPEFHYREFDFAELKRLMDEALSIARSETKKRMDVLQAEIAKLPSTSPIGPIFFSSPFDPSAFFPTDDFVANYEKGLTASKDDVTISHLPRE
jgi:hypothetical protein